MIYVRIEIWPGGDVTRSHEVARMKIANISDLAPLSSYAICASSDPVKALRLPAFETSCLTVSHRRTDSIWVLLAKAMERVAADWREAVAEE